MINEIDPNKLYSIHQAITFMPWVNCEPTLQKMIIEDIEKNNNEKFKAIVLRRSKTRRYYIKGENIINLVKEYNANETKENI